MQQLKLSKITNSFSGEIEIKGSKSISNRLLIIKGLAGSNCEIANLSNSDDTIILDAFLKRIETCERSGIPMIIDVGNAGTIARFLTSYLSFREGMWLITGSTRMRERPMKGIVDGLLQLGANITYQGKEGYLPLKIIGSDIRSKVIDIDVSKSSQFLSSLMLIGPYLEKGLTVVFVGSPVSFPYVEMTQKLMQKFGAHIILDSEKVIVRPGKYEFHSCAVEPDWSSASYWYELVALSKNAELFLPGFSKKSLQGDSIISDIYRQLGVSTEFTNDGIVISKLESIPTSFSYDFSGTPDIVPAVMTTCAALGIDSEFKNIGQLIHKESNRIDALQTELHKVGAMLTKRGNSYLLTNGDKVYKDLYFNTYNDHRMAMCFAPLVLLYDNIEIENPEIVNKSYPNYWDDFKKLNFADLKIQTT